VDFERRAHSGRAGTAASAGKPPPAARPAGRNCCA
jgi:hypothetical protein